MEASNRRRRCGIHFLALVCSLQLHHVQGFVSRDTFTPKSSSWALAMEGEPKNNGEATQTSSCPFSKRFPKYRINFSKTDTENVKSGLSIPFVGDIQKSVDKNKLERKFKEDHVQWIDDDLTSIEIFTLLWRRASQLSSNLNEDRVVLGLTDNSKCGLVRRWKDISDWMQEEEEFKPLLGNVRLAATIYNEGNAMAIKIVRTGNNVIVNASKSDYLDSKTLIKRTQAWVKRILVDQGICPFTKSIKVSGQGLSDLGIPVARIHYCSSDATQRQISELMADTWKEISYMLDQGPKGISSILLAAPEYDNNFDLWSGPIFAMLESGVVACGLEKQVGVVCFHPIYQTPDGTSFPGFGQMHSVPRLQKWVQELDPELGNKLSKDEVAAGGAWQRRTPHATINVLRADQLEAAEGRRVTGDLYTENIRKLVGKPDGIGSDKLMQDLEAERALR